MSTGSAQKRKQTLHWPAVHHSSGTPNKPHPQGTLPKVQRAVAAQPALDINTMAIYIADAVTDAPITDAYFSTTYGSWENGWHLVQDFQNGEWIIVGAPGYEWSSFQGVDGAEEGVGLLPQIW